MFTIREGDRERDRAAAGAIDTSFETASVFEVVVGARSIELTERALATPRIKTYSMGEAFAPWASWDTSWVAVEEGAVIGFAAVEYEAWHARMVPIGEYARFMYLESDARLGNLFLFYLCSSTALHAIWAPVVVVGFQLAMFATALGRWPRPGELRDSTLLLLLFALYWLAIPEVGIMTFYRPFAGIYLHAFLVLLLVVLPYRFAVASGPPQDRWRAPVMFVAGLLGGFTNEHTVPTAILAVVASHVVLARRGVRWPAWMPSGLVGLGIGFAALFFAPAQDKRYGGLARQASILERIGDRGVSGNLELLGELARSARWLGLLLLAGLVAFGVARRLQTSTNGRAA